MGEGVHRRPLAFAPVGPAPLAGRCSCPSVTLGPGSWGEDCRRAGVQRAPRGETSHHIITAIVGTAFMGTFFLPTALLAPGRGIRPTSEGEETGTTCCPRSQPSRTEPAGGPGHHLLRSVLCTRITA